MSNEEMAKGPGRSEYEELGLRIGGVLAVKNAAYGNSFGVSSQFLELLYPNGVQVKDFPNMLTLVRMWDKMKRIATDKDAFGESPYSDLAGYAMLALVQQDREST